jgi:hypothetical protein
MKNHTNFRIILAGILILLLFTVSIACAQTPTLGTTSPTPPQTLGTTPTTPPQTLGTTPSTPVTTIGRSATPTGKGIPLSPVISVVALSCGGLLIIRQKRK